MMKIGILTFHCAYNYGAVLQCYATQEFLRSRGYEVEIINYRPPYLLKPYRLFQYDTIKYRGVLGLFKDIIKELIVFPTRYKRWSGFKSFEKKYFVLSKPIKDNKSMPDKYDVYIVGSDQIWNPNLTKGFDYIYFCDFLFNKDKKKYLSYAPSIGSISFSENMASFFCSRLKNFDAISVREEESKKILSSIIDIPIKCVLDPTLMVPLHIWDKLCSNSMSDDDGNVVIYQAIPNDNTFRIANHIANQLSAKILVIANGVSYYSRGESRQVTPEGFLKTIRSAACVVTTSFHGTAFSVVFNKPFYTLRFDDEDWNVRSASLLNKLGLGERMINATSSPTFSEIDYSKVNPILEDLRKESQDFLLNAIAVSD